MRVRMKTRSLMIAIAVMSPFLAAMALIAREGGPVRFLQNHAYQANIYDEESRHCAETIKRFAKHATLGHTCAHCVAFPRPWAAIVAEARRREGRARRLASWHGFLASPGRPFGIGRDFTIL